MLTPSAGLAAPDLLARAAAGDGTAFDLLMEPLIERAYRLALTMVGREADARDVVQDATLRAWRKIHQMRSPKSLVPWYMAIVVSQSRSWRRKRWWSVVALSDTQPEPGAGAWRAVGMRQAIEALPASYRAAIYLYFYLDLPVEEVANALRVSPSAARSRIYRAVRRLEPDIDTEELYQ